MVKATNHGGWREALAAALMLLSFFMPWLYSMGSPIAAYRIRERLAGPHRLISAFTDGSRISQDYRLAVFLYAIPACAGLILALLLARRYRAWMGLLAGGLTGAAFLFLRGEVAAMPFHRLGWGPYLALLSGAGLALFPLLRLVSGKR